MTSASPLPPHAWLLGALLFVAAVRAYYDVVQALDGWWLRTGERMARTFHHRAQRYRKRLYEVWSRRFERRQAKRDIARENV